MSFPAMPILYLNALRNRANDLITELVSSDFVRKVIETFATRIVLILLGLITSVIVTRTLGPEGRGLFAIAATVCAIGIQFGNFGLHASNTYYVARDRRQLPALLGNTLIVSFVIGGLGAAIAWGIFLIWPGLAPITGSLLVMALIWIPLGLAYMLAQNLLIGIHEIRTYNLIEIVTKVISVALIATVIVMNAVTVENIFLMGLITLILGLVWIGIKLRRHLTHFPKPSLNIFLGSLRYGFKAYLAAFFAFMVLKVDLLMVQYMLGSEQAGYYSIAVSLADMVYMLPVVIGTILFPRLSALSDYEEKWKLASKSAWMVLIIMILVTASFGLLAKPIISLMFGNSFIQAVYPLVWLMPAILLLSVNTVFMNYFASIGMPSITVYSPGIACLINIALNYKLIPYFGIVGASISSIICYGAMLMFSLLYQFRRRVPFAC